MPVTRKSKHYVFTINNPTYPEMQQLNGHCVQLTEPVIDYMIRGYEGFGSGKTPHIQGAVCFRKAVSWRQAKEILGIRAHIEPVKSLFSSAIYYCMKEGDYAEFGDALLGIQVMYPHLNVKYPTPDEPRVIYRPFDRDTHFHMELGYLKEQEAIRDMYKQEIVKHELLDE